MKILKVKEMHCDDCVRKISKAMKDKEISFKISLEKKTLEIENNHEIFLKVIEVLDDIGFSVEELI